MADLCNFVSKSVLPERDYSFSIRQSTLQYRANASQNILSTGILVLDIFSVTCKIHPNYLKLKACVVARRKREF